MAWNLPQFQIVLKTLFYYEKWLIGLLPTLKSKKNYVILKEVERKDLAGVFAYGKGGLEWQKFK